MFEFTCFEYFSCCVHTYYNYVLIVVRVASSFLEEGYLQALSSLVMSGRGK